MRNELTPHDVLAAIKKNKGNINAPELQRFWNTKHVVLTMNYCQKKLKEFEDNGFLSSAGVNGSGCHTCYWWCEI